MPCALLELIAASWGSVRQTATTELDVLQKKAR